MQTSAAAHREFQLSDREFDEIRRLVREHTGIALADSKRELVYSRLVRRLRRLSLATFAEYLALLARGEPAELEEFTNAITTNLTSFFREGHHFEFLADTVLPALERRNAASRRLRIWSAGCSTGEEPYSIAVALQEAMGRFRGWDIKILATDLDSNVVAHAQTGEYREDRFEKVSAARRERYFPQLRPGVFGAAPSLKSLITFRQLNLMHAWPFRGPFDVIFCRNVVIYFDKQTQRELFDRMADLQRNDDHLFIGHSESLFKVSDRYQLIGKTIYRKVR
ncbi:MAG TPA: protein-glutamate O-methyltransferase CheR [Steroidobacteraceae bacterium]|nr:protein-glutamate O-methyltransferase CheR [Steroidobacteraceae bacterium]